MGFRKLSIQQFPAVTGNRAAVVLIVWREFGLRSLGRIQKDTWGVTSIYSQLQLSGLQCYGESAEQREERKNDGREGGIVCLKMLNYYLFLCPKSKCV